LQATAPPLPPAEVPPFVVPPPATPPLDVPPFEVPPLIAPPLETPPLDVPPFVAPPVAELVPATPAVAPEPPSLPPPSFPLFEQATKPAAVPKAKNHADAETARPVKRTNDDISRSSVLGTMATRARGRIPRSESMSLAAEV
jgi:hypothetical protein